MNENYNVIKCPNCEWEYMPGEIYLPKHFLGVPTDIERTIEGKVDTVQGIPQNVNEEFVCEHCHKPFKVHCDMTFKTEYNSAIDFDAEYVTPKYDKERLFLSEE